MLQKSIKQIDVKQLNILQCYMKIKHFNVHMTSNKSYYSHKLENKFSKELTYFPRAFYEKY